MALPAVGDRAVKTSSTGHREQGHSWSRERGTGGADQTHGPGMGDGEGKGEKEKEVRKGEGGKSLVLASCPPLQSPRATISYTK